ncbi:MAG TPA: hypothetical protein VEP49_16585 [Acidimicrobiia bacterium]|nr:hypothetical protein [Acidimicrobiia bacterium]
MCILVFLALRGVALLASRLARRSRRRPPPDPGRDDELVLAA